MKIKTSELIGEALNYAVCVAEGPESYASAYLVDGSLVYLDEAHEPTWEPSINWSQGGPIIEREGISIVFQGDAHGWVASLWDYKAQDWCLHTEGETPLIAAMRCYVASKLGDEIEIPEELKS